MRHLKNWDNKTWLSSQQYIYNFIRFLNKKIRFKQNHLILDIGCGRANVISDLYKKYKFRNKPIGIDIIRNTNIKKNINFKKIDGISYLQKTKKEFDVILLKQTIHFFSQKKLNLLLNLIKKKLRSGGKLLIFSLKTKNNQIPSFKLMKIKLKKSLKRDELLFKVIKKNLKKFNISTFKFKVTINNQKYVKMIESRYISCLLNLKKSEITDGIKEIKLRYKDKIKFTDSLICISFNK